MVPAPQPRRRRARHGLICRDGGRRRGRSDPLPQHVCSAPARTLPDQHWSYW
uniref:Uncharacterized protein n=1 Tax=Arundo donax TaxID=35708 RepID=A0A0A9AGY3_ARUDO